MSEAVFKTFYLWTLEFRYHIFYTCLNIVLTSAKLLSNAETFLGFHGNSIQRNGVAGGLEWEFAEA